MCWAYYGLFVVVNARPPRCFVVGIFGQTIAALKQDPSVNMDKLKAQDDWATKKNDDCNTPTKFNIAP